VTVNGSSGNALTCEVRFDPDVVTVDAIQRAGYRLSDRLSLDVRTEPRSILCTLHANEAVEMQSLAGEFRNEVLDQVLRERIRGETEAARNLILALAFSRTGVVPQD
jgi:His-Xaa-Ser system protein HxsD